MPRINPDNVLWKEMDGKIVVLHIATGTFYEFNSIGSEIWKNLLADRKRDDIITALKDIYDVPEKALMADIDSFLARMIKQGLLEK